VIRRADRSRWSAARLPRAFASGKYRAERKSLSWLGPLYVGPDGPLPRRRQPSRTGRL